jgi:phosphoribosylaminoimidazole-succinocarboxamide synthase
MIKIPPAITENRLRTALEVLPLLHEGKVRDTYELPACEDGTELLLVLTTDRISIYDFVLPALIPGKGSILNAQTAYVKTNVLKKFPTDLVASGKAINAFLPRELKNNFALEKNAVVVKKLKMVPIEFIVRGHLTGGGYNTYQKTGSVCGIKLPKDLPDGHKFEHPLFTPTTKAEEGHDADILTVKVQKEYPKETEMVMEAYRLMYDFSLYRGTIIADTKFELGYDMEGKLCLADETCTPDSSRFWNVPDYRAALTEKRTPHSLDKQLVREYGKKLGIHKKNPLSAEDTAFVHSQAIGSDIIQKTQEIYQELFRTLIGCDISRFRFHSLDHV